MIVVEVVENCASVLEPSRVVLFEPLGKFSLFGAEHGVQFVRECSLRKSGIDRHAFFEFRVFGRKFVVQCVELTRQRGSFTVADARESRMQQLVCRCDLDNAIEALIGDLEEVNTAAGVAAKNVTVF